MISKYAAPLWLGLQSAMTYRLNFALSLVSAFFPIVLQFFLWKAIFSQSQSSTVYGFTYSQMVTYVILANVIAQIVHTGFEYTMSDNIRTGEINRFLIMPISYFGYLLASFVGNRLFSLLASLAIMSALLFGAVMFLDVDASLVRFSLFALALFLSLALNFMLFFLIGLTAFWTVEASGIFEAARIIFLILSGGIFPLEVFGPFWKDVFSWLPFQYVISFPVEIFNGRLNDASMLNHFGMQLFWIISLAGLCQLLWKAGTRRLVAVGG